MRTADTTHTTRYVSTGPARLHVRVAGEGPLLVLLPGLGRPASDLDPLAALLVAGLADSPRDGMDRAAHSIDSGAAWSKLQKLVEFSRA